MEHLVLVDGHHLMYRAYYAIPKTLRTAAGEQTNAVYGVAAMLLTLLRVEQPDRLLFCFDEGEDTFRHQENATYKEGRAETPDDFYAQIPRIMELLDTFPIRRVSDAGFEADDLLCTYARAGEKEGMKVTIVTGDRDAFQLASETTKIAIPHKGYQQPEYLGPQEIFAKYGIRPDQVPSYKGLCGDASDNLPGVKGIGPKGAAALLQQYGTLQGIYEHLDEIKPIVRAKLERDKDQAFFCEHMAQLVCDVKMDYPLSALALTGLRSESVTTFFRDMEFGSLLSRLNSLIKLPYGQTHFHGGAVVALAKKTTQTSPESQLTLF